MSAVIDLDIVIRRPTGEPGCYYYDGAGMHGHMSPMYPSPWVPNVEDFLMVIDYENEAKLTLVRVTDRLWSLSSYGSANWPVQNAHPDKYGMVTLICEEVDKEALYRGDTLRPEVDE